MKHKLNDEETTHLVSTKQFIPRQTHTRKKQTNKQTKTKTKTKKNNLDWNFIFKPWPLYYIVICLSFWFLTRFRLNTQEFYRPFSKNCFSVIAPLSNLYYVNAITALYNDVEIVIDRQIFTLKGFSCNFWSSIWATNLLILWKRN